MKTLHGVLEVRISNDTFSFFFPLAILHPNHAPAGTSVETLWQEMKRKLLNADVLMHACVPCCVSEAALAWGVACYCQQCRSCSEHAFPNALLGATLLPSESLSPWGSRGLGERWLTVGAVRSRFRRIKSSVVPFSGVTVALLLFFSDLFFSRTVIAPALPLYLFLTWSSRRFCLFFCPQKNTDGLV